MSELSSIKILSIVEATTINAVAKNVLEFHRSARDLNQAIPDFQAIEGQIVTFERRSDDAQSPNAFVIGAREYGLPVEVIPERHRFDLGVIPKLRQVVDEAGPDLVVTHSVKSHFLLWRSRLSRRYPWVAFHHGYTTTDQKMRVYNRFDRWSLPKADRLVTVCQAFAVELAGATRIPLQKISVHHNSIRPAPPASAEEVNSLRRRVGIANAERIVLTVGRLSHEKAHVDLLVAFGRLLRTSPQINCKLVIVGDGPERGVLKATSESLGLKEHVIFVGQVSNVQLFYAVADVFVLPSHSEGSPNVVLEAMAAQVPIVATAVGGVPEVVEDNHSALLVPPNDPQALAAAIRHILSDSKLVGRLTTNASALVVTKHSPEQYVRSLVETYQEVVGRRKTLGQHQDS